MRYTIEHLIRTTAKNAIHNNSNYIPFNIDNVTFSHYKFDIQNGWKENFWIAKSQIEASDFQEAFNVFYSKLEQIVPILALVSQCYMNFNWESFLIFKENGDSAFLRYMKNGSPTGLMFRKNHLKAVDKLMKSKIPKEFFNYWKDATNTIGYSSKLSLMCSAIEALVKMENGEKNMRKMERILGKKIKKFLWGEKGNSKNALRHRLIHGEYFEPDDFKNNYVELIHKKIIEYINRDILKEKLIETDVVNPQRSIFDNKARHPDIIVESKNSNPLTLETILEDFDNCNSQNPNFSKKYTVKYLPKDFKY